MASKAPSWAEQWGMADEEDEIVASKKGSSSSGKMADMKVKASVGMDKAKAAAAVGADKAKAVAFVSALKVKSGTSAGINWVKDKCKKKPSST